MLNFVEENYETLKIYVVVGLSISLNSQLVTILLYKEGYLLLIFSTLITLFVRSYLFEYEDMLEYIKGLGIIIFSVYIGILYLLFRIINIIVGGAYGFSK